MAEPNGQYLQLDSRVFVCLLIGGFPSWPESKWDFLAKKPASKWLRENLSKTKRWQGKSRGTGGATVQSDGFKDGFIEAKTMKTIQFLVCLFFWRSFFLRLEIFFSSCWGAQISMGISCFFWPPFKEPIAGEICRSWVNTSSSTALVSQDGPLDNRCEWGYNEVEL